MEVDTAIYITTEQRRTVLALLEQHLPDTAAWVYGSRTKWTSRPASDLDLVVFATPEQRRQVGDLREAFEESNLPFRVDLFVWDEVPKSFRKGIEAEHMVLIDNGSLVGPFGRLPPGWEYSTLGAVCERGGGNIQTGPFGSQLHASDYRPVGIPSIMPQNLGDNRVIVDGIARIGNHDARRLRRYLVRKGDIVYSRRGDVAKRALIGSLEDGWLCGTGCLRVRLGENAVDSRYASYLLGAPAAREWIVRHAHGATMPNLNTAILSACPFVVPPIAEQHAIAHILGTLDDKIEMNLRMNATLEAMARALFKDWFVDFGPTRAKMEGRAPYLVPELWDLFPDALGDKDVPFGWRAGTVSDCFHLTMGQSPPGSTYNDDGEGLPFFQGRTDFGFRYPENRKYCSAPTRIAECDDTLVSVRAPVGDINMAWEKCCAGRGVAALRHASGSRSFTYYSAWAIQQELKRYEHTGTVFGSINKTSFEAISVVEPTPEVIALFENQVAPLDERIRRNISEVRTLTLTRDLLLPKLMSGEIRLRESEEAVEAAA